MDLMTPRLLIVDDEPAQMQALCDTLRDQGYDTVGCASGEAGLAALQQSRFDLLLADLMMPGMDGIALLREALRLDGTLVGVIMTGAGTIESAVQAMQSGALDYILKPFKLSAVVPVLARALSVRRLRCENAALARRVEERTAELERANTELDAFSRSVSHDLRNPLHAVIGLSGLLAAKYGQHLPPDGRVWLGQIEETGKRMNQLIEALLRLAQVGRQALRVEAVDLQALAQAAVAEQARIDAGAAAHIQVGALPVVQGDASLLAQVFANLLSNACKFTRGTAQPQIEVGCSADNGETVLFVRDNGAGFDMSQAQRLFGAFERLHRADQFEGTGIGLSTVQRIVQRHGSRIWAEAAPGRGATFFFTMPGRPT